MSTIEQPKTEAKLPLDSLEIKGYRCFKELTIPKLARVNLITGKNNVGKTALLEAIYLYTKGGSAAALWEILTRREQLSVNDDNDITMILTGLQRSVHGYAFDLKQKLLQIFAVEAGSNRSKKLDMWFHWNNSHPNESKPIPEILIKSPTQGYYPVEHIINKLARDFFGVENIVRGFFVGTSDISSSDRSLMWDGIVLTERKKWVLDIVGLVAGNTVEDMSLLGEATDPLGRVPHVRLQGDPGPKQLSLLGEGMTRAFNIGLALTYSTNGTLLIDEIENGLHYSVLTNVWKTIFDLANRLNVQVFATTHSWECIQAFERVANGSQENDGQVIRLREKNGSIEVLDVSGEDLEIAVESHIEVR